ncbi:hypothetical protein BDZ85DRAFT_301687 [Elsinoe ampelina]|uniref:Uncharacterized protein n=1 Tax=Elsinoe ampelina TaxID=302913 RepID=A0A6A6G6T9_9PEZI|nr:hypothetical protein BDZ85DRAFT_301687 [Elsinoe ampelina]
MSDTQGVSGILNTFQIQKDFLSEPARSSLPTSPDPGIEHVTYEKNHDIGGTWLDNRYPGCACVIPSHAYTYDWALNPDWPRFFSYGTEIWASSAPSSTSGHLVLEANGGGCQG